MYYLVNENQQIIAADEAFLTYCNAKDIEGLLLDKYSNKLTLTLSQENLEIKTDVHTEIFPVTQTSLLSLWGKVTAISLETQNKKTVETIKELETEEEQIDDDFLLFDNDENVTKKDVTETTETVETSIDTHGIPDDLLKVSSDSPNIDIVKEKKEESEIFIDIDQISQKIGITTQDYKTFLNEYIDDALGYESDLNDGDTSVRGSAIAKLSHLGFMLSLPHVGDILEKVAEASDETRTHEIASFYSTLSRICTTAPKQEVAVNNEEVPLFDLAMPLDETKTILSEEKDIPKQASNKSFGTLDLSDVKPIHFDFQIEEAANDLSLPVELIEEFVQDFIEQAQVETQKMLTLYEKGDLDAIQKIGHLLKGASSNLRIKALADTLYNIQFCEDSSQLEKLIKNYWGHFLSFETRIKLISN